MGIGTLRRHRAMLDAATGALPPRTREQVLEDQLAEERARSAALQAQLVSRAPAEGLDVEADAIIKEVRDHAQAAKLQAETAQTELDASRNRVAELEAKLAEFESKGPSAEVGSPNPEKTETGEAEGTPPASPDPSAPSTTPDAPRATRGRGR